MSRRTTVTDAALYVSRWQALRAFIDAAWPGGWAPLREDEVSTMLAAPGYYGYISDDSRLAILVREKPLVEKGDDQAEELFLIAPRLPLSVGRYRALAREVFLAWYAEVAARGDHWTWGDGPADYPGALVPWLADWGAETTSVTKRGRVWTRYMAKPSLAIPRILAVA